MERVEFETLTGKVFTAVAQDNESIIFSNAEETFRLYHDQDCCESVIIESICGELDNLQDTPILLAVESTNSDIPAIPSAYYHAESGYSYEPDSYTWTFYRIGTVKGTVVLRFYGESNGYYSESVSLYKMEN